MARCSHAPATAWASSAAKPATAARPCWRASRKTGATSAPATGARVPTTHPASSAAWRRVWALAAAARPRARPLLIRVCPCRLDPARHHRRREACSRPFPPPAPPPYKAPSPLGPGPSADWRRAPPAVGAFCWGATMAHTPTSPSCWAKRPPARPWRRPPACNRWGSAAAARAQRDAAPQASRLPAQAPTGHVLWSGCPWRTTVTVRVACCAPS